MQLHSVDQKHSRLIKGQAAVFIQFKAESNNTESTILCFAGRNRSGGKLFMYEFETPARNRKFKTIESEVLFPTGDPRDFPFAIHTSTKHGCVYLVTKLGQIQIYDVETGTCIFMNFRIPSETIHATVPQVETGGFLAFNGKVLFFLGLSL